MTNGIWGNPIWGKSQKSVNCYTTAEYTADSVTGYAGYQCVRCVNYALCVSCKEDGMHVQHILVLTYKLRITMNCECTLIQMERV